MQFLDDFQMQEGGRDICQFVPFSHHQYNKQTLTSETLDEESLEFQSVLSSAQASQEHTGRRGCTHIYTNDSLFGVWNA